METACIAKISANGNDKNGNNGKSHNSKYGNDDVCDDDYDDGKNKITFINDSKATNVNSLEKCLEALKPSENVINLILGGVPKGDKLSEIQHLLKSINCVFLIGQSSDDFENELNLIGVKCHKCNTLKNAVDLAFNNCKEIESDSMVVLSPACASFDQFANFEERGGEFKSIAQDICKNHK